MVDLAKKLGAATHRCRRCGKSSGVIRSYNLCYCRQCFREVAKSIGFRKYS